MPQRTQPRPRDAVRLVAQSVHGLRPPVHVLLRPRLRGARRPAVGRPLRREHPRQDERRRRAPARARARRPGSASRSAIGAATDPYQPAEGRYRLTRACIEAFAEAASPFSIITRGPLIVRDIDVLAEAARRADVSGHVLRPDARRRDLAPHRAGHGAAAPAAARARAARGGGHRRAASGWRRSCPGSSDRPELLADVVREARAAGATGIWANLLYLRPGTREHFLAALERDWPELLPGVRAAVPPRRLSPAARDRSGAGASARARTQPRRPRPASRAARARLARPSSCRSRAM